MSDHPRWGRRSLAERLRLRWSGTSREAIEADDEVRSRLSRGTIPISEVQERHKVVVSGVLQSITYSPVDGPVRLLATLYDGTGTIELRWLGRRAIPGISVGRHLEVEGTASLHIDHLVLIDPLYRLLAPGSA
ncbi:MULTISPECIES: hypothetical protein [Actinomyces]|uniref:hypothetical protein n=1 Tax=Actinomyces TaxID=1654 RepID=UPI00096A6666|nr:MULTISPECIES: hypothetical protein [Actinomyces]